MSERIRWCHGGVVLLVLALAGCSGEVQVDGVTTEEQRSFFVPSGNGRIAVRTVGGRQQLYNQATSATFTIFGTNYIKTRDMVYHNFLMTNVYNSAQVDAALQSIANSGYNTVRFFLPTNDYNPSDGYGIGGPYETNGLYGPLTANLKDFLTRAKNKGLHVIPTIDWVPSNSKYQGFFRDGQLPGVEGNNQVHLTPGGREAFKAFWKDVATYITGQDLQTVVLAYGIRNEAHLESNVAPFSWTQGNVTTMDGATYDMGNPSSRQQCFDANMVQWVNAIRAGIREVDSAALVTMGMWTMRANNKTFNGLKPPQGTTDYRYAARPSSLASYSNLDIVDIHVYPLRNSWTLFDDLNSSEYFQINLGDNLVVMGEFGAIKDQYSLQDGAVALCKTRVDAFKYGMIGASSWTWDTSPSELWNSVEGGGAINGQLAPISGNCLGSGGTTPGYRGMFIFASGIYYTNGTTYCLYDSWEHFKCTTGRSDTKGIPAFSQIPSGLRSDGYCVVPAKCQYQGMFKVGAAIYYTNGATYCHYDTWEHFKCMTGRTNADGIPAFSQIPSGLRSDGTCVVPAKCK